MFEYVVVAESDHSDKDCVAVCILTHGMEPQIYKRDDNKIAQRDRMWSFDEEIYLEDLIGPFKSQRCHESLRGKPKLFFIQVRT